MAQCEIEKDNMSELLMGNALSFGETDSLSEAACI